MRIMLLTSTFENVASYFRAFHLGKQLAIRGHTVFLVAKRKSFGLKRETINNLHIYLLPSLSGPTYFSKVEAGFSTVFSMGYNVLLSLLHKTDILYVFDVVSPENAMVVVLSKIMLKRRPLIFVDWDEWWGRGGMLEAFYKEIGNPTIQFLTFLEEKIPIYSDAVTVLNETLKKRAITTGVNPDKIFVLPNGINLKSTDYIETKTARKLTNLWENSIIYTCSKSSFDKIRPYNDPLWDLLVAHKEVNKVHPETKLMFLGRNSENCLKTAKMFNMGKNIISIGYQLNDKYALYLSASDFFVIPLKVYGTPFDDSRIPLRLLDYMALGKPLIATNLLEIRKMIGDCGLLAKPNDPKDLAEKIIKMIENLNLWIKKAKEKREEIIRRYSWQHIVEQLEKYFCECQTKFITEKEARDRF